MQTLEVRLKVTLIIATKKHFNGNNDSENDKNTHSDGSCHFIES